MLLTWLESSIFQLFRLLRIKDLVIGNNIQTISYDTKFVFNPKQMMIQGVLKTLTWEGRRLTGITGNTYQYNGECIRIKKITPNESTTFELEGSNIITMNKNTSTENVRLDFVYDGSATLIGLNTIEGYYFYVRDITGNILGLIDNDGQYMVKYTYDAWGKVLEKKMCVSCIASRHNPFIYKGYFFDEETGFYYLKSSYYDPEIGRFLSPASIESLDPYAINGLNLYSLPNSNPVTFMSNNANIYNSGISGGFGGGSGGSLVSGNQSANMFLKLGVGAVPDIITGVRYLVAKGIHRNFVYSTNTLYMFPELGANWTRFKIANIKYGELAGASFKQIVTGNARAGWGAVAKSFGKTAALTGLINFGFNFYENNWQVDGAMLLDTAIDTAIGLGAYGLAVGTASLVVGGLAMAGLAIPGFAVVVGIIGLSIFFDWAIREITGYKD